MSSFTDFSQLNPFFGSLDDLLSPPTFTTTSSASSPPNELTFSDLESILNNPSPINTPFNFSQGANIGSDFSFTFGSTPAIDDAALFESIMAQPLPLPTPLPNSPLHPVSPVLTDSASESDAQMKKAVPAKRGRKKKELTAEQAEEKSKERLMKNREAAQQSRDKKRKYMDDLEATNATLSKRLVILESQNQTLLSRLEEMALQLTEMRGMLQVSKGVGEDRNFITNLAKSTTKSSTSWSVRLINSLSYPNFTSSPSASSPPPSPPASSVAPKTELYVFPLKNGKPSSQTLSNLLENPPEGAKWLKIAALIPPSSKAGLVRPWWLVAHKDTLFPNLGLFRAKVFEQGVKKD
ncbi:hypothetical protein HDU67_001700 [Dinochytrium kinnereticum]|nr:hypothetical protein HDU67_001700 [Dinochytrium kinnereticum]